MLLRVTARAEIGRHVGNQTASFKKRKHRLLNFIKGNESTKSSEEHSEILFC